MKVCCFSGTKPHKVIWKHENFEFKLDLLKNEIKLKLVELIEKHHVRHFINGITVIDDLFTAEIVLELKKVYPVTLELSLLFEDQPSHMEPEHFERFLAVTAGADVVTSMCGNYSNESHKLLTEYLVKKGDYFMVLLDSMTGFALDTICKAHEQGKSVFIINPQLI